MSNKDNHIYTLHRYFIWANRLRDHFRAEVQSQGPPPDDPSERGKWLIGPFGYFSMWMGMLYVVIEGWMDLRLSHPGVEKLIKEDNVRILKRYRNGVYHFQKTYFDRRCLEFIDKGDPIADWADDLHDELSNFFLEWYSSRE